MFDTEVSMSDYVQIFPPSPSRVFRDVDGYYAAFYPGFVRRLAVRTGTSETVVYEQKESFILPAGQTEAWPCSELEFSGGPGGRDIRLQVSDPLHQIARIEVVFKDADPSRSTGDEETLVIDETPLLCPPICPEG
jgi:hypothetical protein